MQGWPLIRGGRVGPLTTANALFRIKGASPGYYGAYTPIPGGRTGVHCAGVDDVLSGSCLERLKAYIEKTDGKYYNPGYVPPPNR